MSVCRIIASDTPLTEHVPSALHPLSINADWCVGGCEDDEYSLFAYSNVRAFSCKEYGVRLEWEYTVGRAGRIVEYIKDVLTRVESVEFWLAWEMDYYEFEDRPFVHRKTITADEITVDHIREIDSAKIWNTPDKMYPDRPSFYCLTVTR